MAYGDEQWECGDRRITSAPEKPDNPARIVPEMVTLDSASFHSDWSDARMVEVVRARAAKLNAAVEEAEARGIAVHVAKDRQSNKIAAITAAKEF